MTKEEIAELEAQNGLKQFDLGMTMIEYFLDPHTPFDLQPSHIQDLQKVAVDGLLPEPGEWRRGDVMITGSAHTPPGPHLVKSLMTEFCEFINGNLHEKTAFELAAYTMWRLNWIHPFPDGNGRTSRMVSYIVMTLKLGHILNGSPTIPEQIQQDRSDYIRALEVADETTKETGEADLGPMIDMLRNYLAKQLLSVIENAQGGIRPS